MKGHAEVDVSKLKREEQSLEEIMSELKASEVAGGMEKVQGLKKEMGMAQ